MRPRAAGTRIAVQLRGHLGAGRRAPVPSRRSAGIRRRTAPAAGRRPPPGPATRPRATSATTTCRPADASSRRRPRAAACPTRPGPGWRACMSRARSSRKRSTIGTSSQPSATPLAMRSLPAAHSSGIAMTWWMLKRVKLCERSRTRSRMLPRGLPSASPILMTRPSGLTASKVRSSVRAPSESTARSTPAPSVRSSTAATKSVWPRLMTASAPYFSGRFSLPGVPTVPMTRAPAPHRELG